MHRKHNWDIRHDSEIEIERPRRYQYAIMIKQCPADGNVQDTQEKGPQYNTMRGVTEEWDEQRAKDNCGRANRTP